jgi:hypothetical protein
LSRELAWIACISRVEAAGTEWIESKEDRP